ncbi:hypothetical protein D1872_151610 [compost metagenome]
MAICSTTFSTVRTVTGTFGAVSFNSSPICKYSSRKPGLFCLISQAVILNLVAIDDRESPSCTVYVIGASRPSVNTLTASASVSTLFGSAFTGSYAIFSRILADSSHALGVLVLALAWLLPTDVLRTSPLMPEDVPSPTGVYFFCTCFKAACAVALSFTMPTVCPLTFTSTPLAYAVSIPSSFFSVAALSISALYAFSISVVTAFVLSTISTPGYLSLYCLLFVAYSCLSCCSFKIFPTSTPFTYTL